MRKTARIQVYTQNKNPAHNVQGSCLFRPLMRSIATVHDDYCSFLLDDSSAMASSSNLLRRRFHNKPPVATAKIPANEA